MKIHEFLRQRLDELDLSLADLEGRLSRYGHRVSRQAIGMWVRGISKPPLKDRAFVEALARALEVSANEMLTAMDFIVPMEKRSLTAQRIAELVEQMPPEKQDLALRLIEELAK